MARVIKLRVRRFVPKSKRMFQRKKARELLLKRKFCAGERKDPVSVEHVMNDGMSSFADKMQETRERKAKAALLRKRSFRVLGRPCSEEVYHDSTKRLDVIVSYSVFSAVVIPSGEGKTTLCRSQPNIFFDVDDISRLPRRKTTVRRGLALMVTEGFDYSSLKNKVLLVGNKSQIPDGFDTLGEFALCECVNVHPHTSRLLLRRAGQVRMNHSDRLELTADVKCFSTYEARDLGILRMLRVCGLFRRQAEAFLKLEAGGPAARQESSGEGKRKDKSNELLEVLKVRPVSVQTGKIDHDHIALEDCSSEVVGEKFSALSLMPGIVGYCRSTRH